MAHPETTWALGVWQQRLIMLNHNPHPHHTHMAQLHTIQDLITHHLDLHSHNIILNGTRSDKWRDNPNTHNRHILLTLLESVSRSSTEELLLLPATLPLLHLGRIMLHFHLSSLATTTLQHMPIILLGPSLLPCVIPGRHFLP